MSSLSEIEPKELFTVLDLAKAAGIDVSKWTREGQEDSGAKRNPAPCYEWSFLQPGKVVVLNLWHKELTERADGTVVYQQNWRELTATLKGQRGKRAQRTDEAIQAACNDSLPIRVIVLEGRRRGVDVIESEASKVSKRLLDPVVWNISRYDNETGQCELIRGGLRYVDQFSLRVSAPKQPERREVSGQTFVRSGIVRTNVLSRAGGKCELCQNLGFKTPNGSLFLETHHVIALGEGGSDRESNVAALCPNHHREAHHGAEQNAIREKLLAHLKSLYGE